MNASRSRDSFGPAAVMLLVAACILLLYARFAHAGTDPSVAITSAVDTGLSVWTTDGPLWLAIAVGYVALRTFLSRQHWLAQGRMLAVLTGIAGVGVAVIGWHFSGAPSTGILTALFAAIALVQHPTVPAPARNTQAGVTDLWAPMVITVILGVVFGGLALASSCSPGSTARQTTASGVVAALDCETAHLDAQALDDARLFADAKAQSWIIGTKPGDLDALKARIAADLAPIKSDLGRCAITGALAAATVVLTPRPGTAVQGLATAGPDPAQVRAAFGLAARAVGWAPVKATDGTVL